MNGTVKVYLFRHRSGRATRIAYVSRTPYQTAMPEEPTTAGPEDHRLRSARQKRERMRAHLLASVLAVFPGDDPGEPTVIDDVIRHAEVARGTFYKYFRSLDEAVNELAAQVAQEFIAACHEMYSGLGDVRLRTATGFQLFISRAIIDRRWASFVSHIGALGRESEVLQQLGRDLTLGRTQGVFHFHDSAVALDLIVGAVVEGMRRSMEGPVSRSYVETMAGMLLRSLSVPPDEADAVAATASARLHREAPARLPWWRPFC